MNRHQLEHAVRSACEISGDNELYIFGSQAILGRYPDAGKQLCKSIEVDLCPKNRPEAIDKIDGALGENSPFHQTHGFYVHGVSLETATLPEKWKERTTIVRDYLDEKKIGWCVEAHDLCASKLIAFREKDTEFVRILLTQKMIEADKLIDRIEIIEGQKELKKRAFTLD